MLENNKICDKKKESFEQNHSNDSFNFSLFLSQFIRSLLNLELSFYQVLCLFKKRILQNIRCEYL